MCHGGETLMVSQGGEEKNSTRVEEEEGGGERRGSGKEIDEKRLIDRCVY